MSTEPPRFREVQQFRQWWLWGLLLLSVGIIWWGFIQQVVLGHPWGDQPGPDWLLWMLFVLVGLGVPLFFWRLRLVTEITGPTLRVSFRPFPWRVVQGETIHEHEATTYRPIRHYGGWGWRYGGRHGWCFTVRGTRGVRLRLEGDKQLLLGSARADELDKAIHEICGEGTGPEQAGLRMGRPVR